MKNPALISRLAVTGMGAGSTTWAAPKDAPSASICANRDVTIVEVESGIRIPGQTVVNQGNQIDKIGAEGKIQIPQGATISAEPYFNRDVLAQLLEEAKALAHTPGNPSYDIGDKMKARSLG